MIFGSAYVERMQVQRVNIFQLEYTMVVIFWELAEISHTLMVQ
jgi:hypothetical protein